MAKRPKYKRGFTHVHYFDEWWDRLSEEFKVKLFISIFLLVVFGGGLGFHFWSQYQEKREFLEAIRTRQVHLLAQEQAKARLKLGERQIPVGTLNPQED
ncbi:MAG: hypothetical protein EB056_06465 [Verrucomicrobia bacterium]|nr:hypothetical protein [Verrucomicrobiota bacterium]